MTYRTIFEAVANCKRWGGEITFEPRVTADFTPTAHPAGSPAKVAVLAHSLERGQPLWHPDDNPLVMLSACLSETTLRRRVDRIFTQRSR